MRKISKQILSLLLTTFFLVGCNSNKKNSGVTPLTNTTKNVIETTDIDQTKEPGNTITTKEPENTITTKEPENSVTTITTKEPENTVTSTKQNIVPQTTVEEKSNLSSNDNIVIESFKNLKTEIGELLTKENLDEAKTTCKETFVMIVDFIFFDGDIKGVKFDDLTEAGKEEILSISNTIDGIIVKKFPNYKEEISDKASTAYNKASELIKKGCENIKDFSKDKLGEDNYNKIKTTKDKIISTIKDEWDDTKEDAGELADKVKEKIKNWYIDWKND